MCCDERCDIRGVAAVSRVVFVWWSSVVVCLGGVSGLDGQGFLFVCLGFVVCGVLFVEASCFHHVSY